MTLPFRLFDRAFHPRVVAVVGDKAMNGFMWLRALQGFAGRLYSVQIDPHEIAAIEALGVPNVRTLREIPQPVDYAVVAVPRAVVPRVLADCVQVGVPAVTLFTAGFSEAGDDEGVRLEREIVALAQREGVLLIGPNCMGVANPSLGLCNYPGLPSGAAAAGKASFIGQSGTHTIAFCQRAPADGLGVRTAVSIGNGAVADATDFLAYMRDDRETAVIGAYIEGVRAGRRFFEELRATTPRKPVVLWKGGVSAAGARAIFSHTAALATPTAVWRGMVRQAGALAVDSLDALIDTARALAAGKGATGWRAGLVAMTGGPSVAMTDAFAAAGLSVPPLDDTSRSVLAEFFQKVGGSFGNPLDAGSTIVMGFRADNLERILAVLDAAPEIDVVALDLGAGLTLDIWREHPDLAATVIAVLAAFAQRSPKPFAVVVDAPHRPAESAALRRQLHDRGVLGFATARRAACALRQVVEYTHLRMAIS
ncbi:CoA-binding protein [Candidatus Binatia bacterium]|nr:CoA-binding protein [Candidatus Binatia bacterium]